MNKSIYHAFDTNYLDIIFMLDDLQQQGYSHIQISPPQKSRTSTPSSEIKFIPSKSGDNTKVNIKNDLEVIPWWYQYQPIEFVVGNKYGSKEELKLLAQEVHKKGMKLIADICINFMAEIDKGSSKEWLMAEKKARKNDTKSLDELMEILDKSYPPFNKDDFKDRSFFDKSKKRYINNWYMGQLPALKLDTEKVQKVHFKYLRKLMKLGVDGFRYDCAQWIKPETLQLYLNAAPSDCNYLEVIERRNIGKIITYSKLAPVLDYRLGELLVTIFKKKNKNWITNVHNLEDEIKDVHFKNVLFSVNHDTFHSKQSKLSLNFDHYSNNDDEDNKFNEGKNSAEILASCLLLSLKNGIPLIFNENKSKHRCLKSIEK